MGHLMNHSKKFFKYFLEYQNAKKEPGYDKRAVFTASFAVPRLGGGLLRTPNGSVDTVIYLKPVGGPFGCHGRI